MIVIIKYRIRYKSITQSYDIDSIRFTIVYFIEHATVTVSTATTYL